AQAAGRGEGDEDPGQGGFPTDLVYSSGALYRDYGTSRHQHHRSVLVDTSRLTPIADRQGNTHAIEGRGRRPEEFQHRPLPRWLGQRGGRHLPRGGRG